MAIEKSIRILFVCHGNICRSPMAEFVMKEIVRRNGKERRYEIASAATSREELGNPIYAPAKRELRKRGIPFDESKRAAYLTKSAYDRYDLFVVMDEYNRANILRIFGSDPEKKVKKLLDYTENGGDVADPWYTDRFDVAFCDILRGCEALFDKLEQNVPRETTE